MSAVRDAIANAPPPADWESQGDTDPDAILTAISSLPLAARIAYARELLAGSEWVVTRVPDRLSLITDDPSIDDYSEGHSVCRDAVVAD